MVMIVVGILLIAAVFHYVGQSGAHKAHMAAIAHQQQHALTTYDVAAMDSRMSDRMANLSQRKYVSAERNRRDTTAAMLGDANKSVALRGELQKSTAMQLGGSFGAPQGGSQQDEERLENSLFRRR
jgi:hypothetical protein